MIHYIENERILSEVLENEKLVLIEFYAPWCEPCKMLSPVLKSIEEKMSEKIVVYKVDVDENQEIKMRYQITAMPTILFFKEGEEIERQVGFVSEEKLSQIIMELWDVP